MKHPIILQHSEEDCGAACLASIAKYHGKQISMGHARRVTGTGALGTNLLNLRQGAKALGLDSRGVKATPQLLQQGVMPLPAIIHWQGNHWVVLYRYQRGQCIIGDPAVGIRSLPLKTLQANWSQGLALLLTTTATFHALSDDPPPRQWRQIWRRLWRDRTLLLQALLINIFVGLLGIAMPFLLQVLTDDVLVRGDTQLLTQISLGVLLLICISSGLRLIQSTVVAHIAQRLELGLGLQFGQSMLNLPLDYYESHRSGEVASRLRDIQQLNQLIAQIVVTLPSQFFIALISLLVMTLYSPSLMGVSLLIALGMTLSTLFFLPTLTQNIQNVLLLTSEIQGLLVESFKGALTLKVSHAADSLWDELQSRYGRQAQQTLRTTQIMIFNTTFFGLVSGAGSILLLWSGGHLVAQKLLTIGQLLAFSTLSGNFFGFISTVLGIIDQFTRSRSAIQRVSEVIEAVPLSSENAQKPWVPLSSSASITCSKVTFQHPGRGELFENLSLSLPGGQVIALVGASGCGKSTLAKLIAGLHFPQAGTIRFDTYSLNDLSENCIRKQIVLVPQEAHFWNRSISENLALGSDQIPFEQMVHACLITGADGYINQLPSGYQTILGEFGCNLSGGQRQRLAIARGLIHDPPVLILDESTASLDPVSESSLLKALLTHRQGKTTLLISHRPSVIRQADWIVFLANGEIRCQGKPSALQQQPGEHLGFLDIL
jgi:ABC-type bacteriocin/lantibiotic exporter with double-glycine peptidase domain